MHLLTRDGGLDLRYRAFLASRTEGRALAEDSNLRVTGKRERFHANTIDAAAGDHLDSARCSASIFGPVGGPIFQSALDMNRHSTTMDEDQNHEIRDDTIEIVFSGREL